MPIRKDRSEPVPNRERTVPAEALVPQHDQHTRKGQAQSPRELTHNEPPKKKRKGGL
ncbi:MAG: hypothetical protein M3303_13310 [Gemmatimonadota bacterium]|jgi:hypothetical protein|nr:hypothetical protein [Gemmatimonadota bacterium]